MSVSLRVGPIAYPIGRADFLGSFFDTVTIRLEGGARGSRFPTLAALYRDGESSPDAAELARAELANVELELRQYPPTDVVWDIDDPALALPWGSDIADAKLLNRHKETAPYRAVTQPGSTPASAGIAPARGLA